MSRALYVVVINIDNWDVYKEINLHFVDIERQEAILISLNPQQT